MSDGPYRPEDMNLETSLGYFVSKARNVLVTRMDQAVKPLGISSPQIGVMLLLAERKVATPFELSRTLSYDSGSMTRMLDRLEKKGCIVRERSGLDRRKVEIRLTESGKKVAALLPEHCTRALNQQVAHFSDADLKTLTGLLQRFIANGPDPSDDKLEGINQTDGDGIDRMDPQD
jgi:DNA-binding MarR family transcriptional regulator